jgi:ABC-2 type transport system permease protein
MAEVTEGEVAIRFAVGEGATRDEAVAAVAGLIDLPPQIVVETTEVGESLFEGIGGQFEIGATSQLILFMFLTGLTGSAALIQSKRLGVTRRMLSTPTSSLTVVAGEAVGRFAVVLVQGLYIVLVSMLMFQVDWGNLFGAAAIIAAFGACGAGGAMLFGTLFRNEQQAAGVGVIAGIGLAALGGCMVPIELFPPAMETVARFTPHAWALDAFAELQRRDGTIADILPQLGVILAFAAVLIGFATWRMRVTLGRA